MISNQYLKVLFLDLAIYKSFFKRTKNGHAPDCPALITNYSDTDNETDLEYCPFCGGVL